jgi:hypothetical protein
MSELPDIELYSNDPMNCLRLGLTFPGSRLESKLIEQLRGDGDLCDVVNGYKAEFEQQGIDQDDLSLLEHSVLVAA